MLHRPTAAVRSAACLTLALCAMLVGCATSGTPVALTQWGWGRSLDLSKNKSQPPSFAPKSDVPKSDEDVTVVDPEDEASSKSAPKEPRRLFGLGGSKKPESEFESNRTHHDRNVVPKIVEPDAAHERHWYNRFTPARDVKPVVNTDAERSRQQKIYDEAEQLSQDKHYAESNKLLLPLTKKNQPFLQKIRFWSIDPDYHEDHNRVREDSMFLLAENYFKQERFSKSEEYYTALLKEYPSTRHLNASTRRLFVIGQTWLGMPGFATSNDVTPVNLENPRATPIPKKQKPPHSGFFGLVPNLTDKSRPSFDTPGHALDALKAIWMYDPRGPLADDAIMMTASHYVRIGNYQEADRYFSMLREEYPSSPHLQTSFVLGSHVKLMSYQGAGYDVKQLDDAKQLKESTLRLFPNLPEKERLRDELARIEEARAQRLWELVELYGRKNKPKAQIIYAEDLLETYPKSSFAPKARDLLAKLRVPVVEKPPLGTRVLNSLPRLRKPTEEDAGEEEIDTRGRSHVDEELPDAPNSTDPAPKDDAPKKKRPSAADDVDELQLLRNSQ